MKSKTTILTLALMLALLNFNNSFSASNYSYSSNTQKTIPNEVLQGYALYVPAGVTCDGLLSQEISSESAVVGQNISVVLTDDFMYNNQLIAPSGSVVNGSVVQNQKTSLGNRNGQTLVKFTTIRTPYNNIIPISAVIATSDNTGVLKGGTKKDSAKDYVKDSVVGAGSGAVLGTVMGALSGGSVGKGAAYGTAVGAGVGVVKGALTKGDPVSIPANSKITLFFNQPITLTAQ